MRQDLLATSVPVMDIEITVPVEDIPMAGIDVPIATELADPRNTVETVHGMPICYGGDLNDSDYETPGDNDYDTWEDWCDSGDIRDRYCGFPPDDEEAQWPVIISAPVFREKDMDDPLRVQPDNWDASVSVIHVDPDPVMAVLPPETVRNNEIAMHQLEEKCPTNASSVLPLNPCDLSSEMGPMDTEGLPICPQDTQITISDGQWGEDLLCLLIFSSQGNAVNLPVVGGLDWRGLTHWRGIVWDPGIIGVPRLRLCYDCLCLITLFPNVLLFVRGQTDSSARCLKDIGDWRTISWELGSLGRDHPYCFAALS